MEVTTKKCLPISISFAPVDGFVRSEDEDGESVLLKSKIDRVLVFSNQAIITRIAEHNLQGEKTRLRIEGLLTSPIDDSVRVRQTGTALPRMLNLEVILVHKSVFMKEELPRNSKSFCRKLGR